MISVRFIVYYLDTSNRLVLIGLVLWSLLFLFNLNKCCASYWKWKFSSLRLCFLYSIPFILFTSQLICLLCRSNCNPTRKLTIHSQCNLEVSFILWIKIYSNIGNIIPWKQFISFIHCLFSFTTAFKHLWTGLIYSANLQNWLRISIWFLFFKRKTSLWRFVYLQAVICLMKYLKSKVHSFWIRIVAGFIYIRGIIVYFCDCKNSKLFDKIWITHKKYSIFAIFFITNPIFFSLIDFIPYRIIIRPFSFELSSSPSVSKLHHSLFSLSGLNLNCI